MNISKIVLEKAPEVTYEKVLDLWKKEERIYPFSGQFLVRLTSELNLIEGINVSYHETREIFENESVQNYTGDVRDLYSVLNNKNVAEYLNKQLWLKAPITVEMVKETHRLLMFGSIDRHRYHNNGERAGEFKKKEYAVGRYDVGAPSSEVERLIQEVCDMCTDAAKNPLKYATAFHCYFQHIHPFADGNGRVGRWLTNYLLVLNGHPPVVFPSNDKTRYYLYLEEFDRDENFGPFYDWLKEQTVASYRAWY